IQLIAFNPSGSYALIVGNGGLLLRYQNGVITTMTSGTTNILYSIAWNPNGQYALIGGSSGSILRTDGTTTTALATTGLYPTTAAIRYISWNSGGTLAILVGTASGVVLTYNGTSLTSLTPVTSNGLYTVAWSGDTATILGNGGTMITFANGSLKLVPTGLTSSFRGISWKPN
ncbi:MAG TPA: WD40 repeat domain-containing protein, partial [Candidatus Binatus sp.]|nr:WD40 repeat domain-containing protein [Candidatus Binatus sp.]